MERSWTSADRVHAMIGTASSMLADIRRRRREHLSDDPRSAMDAPPSLRATTPWYASSSTPTPKPPPHCATAPRLHRRPRPEHWLLRPRPTMQKLSLTRSGANRPAGVAVRVAYAWTSRTGPHQGCACQAWN
jgi:hypothetical protein